MEVSCSDNPQKEPQSYQSHETDAGSARSYARAIVDGYDAEEEGGEKEADVVDCDNHRRLQVVQRLHPVIANTPLDSLGKLHHSHDKPLLNEPCGMLSLPANCSVYEVDNLKRRVTCVATFVKQAKDL